MPTTFEDIKATEALNRMLRRTGDHVFGRGHKGLNGKFSEEASKSQKTRKRNFMFGKDGSRRKPRP